MKRTFIVSGSVTVSCYTKVEAENIEEAKEIAETRGLSNLCHMPFEDGEDESWHIEMDGEPIVEVVEEDEKR